MCTLFVLIILCGCLTQAFRLRSTPVTRGGFLPRAVQHLGPLAADKSNILVEDTRTAVVDINVVVGQTNLLVDIWKEVAFPLHPQQERDFRLRDYNLCQRDLPGLLQHLQNCKDCAGEGAYIVPWENVNGDTVLTLSKVQP